LCWLQAHDEVALARQCELAGIVRSRCYYQAAPESALTVAIMHRIDTIYTAYPFYGSRRVTAALRRLGYAINRKRTVRLMALMGLEAIYPKPNLSQSHPEHRVYPYLLDAVMIDAPDQVWSTDITYIRLERGFMYLVAVLDWYSRKVMAWRLSNTLDVGFCLTCLEAALQQGCPVIFNSDQGSQFTSREFTERLKAAAIRISMDGRGRALDNVFVERLWRSVKYEEVYPKAYRTVADAESGLAGYFDFYNARRLHQALNYATPNEVHDGRVKLR
jgi:putative transposase